MKNFIVIGASGYIGSQIYADLKNKGHEVLGSYYKNSSSDLYLDLLNEDSINKFSQNISFQKIDAIFFAHAAFEAEVLVGCRKGEQLESTNFELLNKFVNANSVGVLKVLQKLLTKLEASKNPNIIFLGSLVGKKALNAPLAFSLGKSCLNGLVESLSKDLGQKNIKVNSVDPGMLSGGVAKYICEADREDYIKHCALERFGKAQEIANICTWLGEKNTFITGKPFVCDGAL